MYPAPIRTPLTETSTVLVISRLYVDAANDNGATARVSGWWTGLRLRRMSPAVAFSAGFAAAGVLVAVETMMRLHG